MGDHRAQLKATFEFHGKTYNFDSGYVNWDPERSPCRVEDWLRECWDDGYARWEEKVLGPARRAEEERQEREQLARLKAKYEK